MRHPKAPTQLLALALTGAAAAAVVSCSDDDHGPKPLLGPSTVVLRMPAELGAMQRDPVDFDHGAHTNALGTDSCKSCHSLDEKSAARFDPVIPAGASADDVMNAYHDRCMDCHDQRAKEGKSTGPLTCGGCHNHRHGSVRNHVGVHFDYSLHHRHSEAEGGKCETCHHVYDEKAGKLVYVKGEEAACRDCHGEADRGRNPSLRRASHAACVNCHTGRAGKGEKTGPVLCTGCHDSQALAAIKPLDNVPRLMRGQPDMTWVRTDGATVPIVPFNHEAHEGVTSSCSSCHHQTLRACKDCHTIPGKREGGFVTLERAYHHPTSTHSCVGCHDGRTKDAGCAGCHDAIAEGPGDASCRRCHSGPPADAPSIPDPNLPTMDLVGLPAAGSDFPADLELHYMPGGQWAAARFPHQRIVQRLDRETRESPLAVRFHGQMETLCAGCHHNTPIGSRPPKCSSCHAEEGEATRDRPGLQAALHRQCIGCHQQMDVKSGCADCHAEAGKEESK